MVVFHKKSHRLALQRERVFSAVDAVATAGCSDPATPPAAISHEFCQGCDPAEGDLNLERAERKRQQLRSLASHVLSLSLPPSPKFVEFGSGSGHLGLLIASLRPDSSVVLVEIKQISCESAAARIASAGLTNCSIFHGSVDDFADSHSTFDVAIGLHLCGLLTDSVLELTTRRGALACIVPCCYGQLAGVENHDRGGGTAPRQWPRSTAYRAALGPEGMLDFEAVVKSADAVAVGRGGAFDADSPGFAVARRCMACVDADRLLWAREERGYSGRLAALAPLSCSPKNSVLLLEPPRRLLDLPHEVKLHIFEQFVPDRRQRYRLLFVRRELTALLRELPAYQPSFEMCVGATLLEEGAPINEATLRRYVRDSRSSYDGLLELHREVHAEGGTERVRVAPLVRPSDSPSAGRKEMLWTL